MTSAIFGAIVAGMLWAPPGPRQTNVPQPERPPTLRALIDDMRDDDRPGNLNAAMRDLAQPHGPFELGEVLRNWRETRDMQLRDALTGVIWYHEESVGYLPQIALRTLAMLTQMEHYESLVPDSDWGYNAVAVKFLALQVAHERDRRVGDRPVTDAVRRLAWRGAGRSQFLAWCLLAWTHDPVDRDGVIAFLAPHVADNDIIRDSLSAMRALREIGTRWPEAIRAMERGADVQATHAIRSILRDLVGRSTDAALQLDRRTWPRLPGPTNDRFDALHPGWSDVTPLVVEVPAAEFMLGHTPMRFTQRVVFEHAVPEQWLQAWQGNRWTTIAIGATVQRGIGCEETHGTVNTVFNAAFERGIFRTQDGTEFLSVHEDRGAANGRAWTLVVVPFHKDVLLPGNALEVDCGVIEWQDGEPRVQQWDMREAHHTGGSIITTFRWDGRHWIDTLQE
jgi:hypothetical protein